MMWFVPGPRVTNSENCFRGFTTYFGKKLGQKELIRLVFLLRTNQPATWLPSKCSRQKMQSPDNAGTVCAALHEHYVAILVLPFDAYSDGRTHRARSNPACCFAPDMRREVAEAS